MSSYPCPPWQDGDNGFCEDGPFPRPPNDGIFFPSDLPYGKAMQNGGPRGQLGPNRDRSFPGGPGPHWGPYPHNGFREEFPRHMFGERPPGPPHLPPPPHFHHEQLRDSPPHDRGYPNHSPVGPPPHLPHEQSGDFNRRPVAPPSYLPIEEDRSQFNRGRKYDVYSSPTRSSSSWSPTMDSPDSPLKQQGGSSPPSKERGLGIRHFRGPSEDTHFHPPQRRPLLAPPGPGPPRKFTFHNTRVQDMAQPPPPRLETKSLLSVPVKDFVLWKSGNMGTSEEDPVKELPEMDFVHSMEQQASRDPRLKRKVAPQTPSVSQVAVPKRKPDIHLMVHQILSEHSYCKGWNENEPRLDFGTKLEVLSGGEAKESSFLSVLDKKACSRDRDHLASKKRGRPLSSKPQVPAEKSEVSSRPNKSESCVMASCSELSSQNCVDSDRDHEGQAGKGRNEEVVLVRLKSQGKLVAGVNAFTPAPDSSQSILTTGPKPADGITDQAMEVIENPIEVTQSHEEADTPLELTDAEGEGVESEDSASDDNFFLDVDSDGFSSSDEVLPPPELLTVQHPKESYIISLPSSLNPALARNPLDSQNDGLYNGTKNRPIVDVGSSTVDVPETAVDSSTGSQTDLLADASLTPRGTDIVPVSSEEAVPEDTAVGSGKDGPSQWSITNFDPRKNLIRLSKVDLQSKSLPEAFIVSNRLALYASNSSPSGSSVTESCDPSRSEGTPVSGGEGDLESPSLSSLDSNSSLVSSLGGEGVKGIRGGRRGRGGSSNRKRHWRRCTQMSTRRTRAAKLADTMGEEEGEPRPAKRRRTRGRRGGRTGFQEFRPEVLTTRSRAETATMKRRLEMEKEMERHERERILTARPEDLEGEELVERGAILSSINMDDLSSEALSSYSQTSSSLLSSRDVDGSSVRSFTSQQEEFSPETIARCKKITTTRNSGDTPLHKVCRTGKMEMARYLITVDNASVNAQDHAGWTPLHEACGCNHPSMAELLLKAGADANMSASDGTRPIHDAIDSGNLELVKLLVSNGADPMAEFGEKTPTEIALSKRQMEIHAFLEAVVKQRLLLRSQKITPLSTSPGKAAPKKPTRASKKDELLKDAGDSQVAIPVDGYGSDGPYCGEELSYPLFYVTPIIELSDCPFLPVYNFKLSSGTNPRCHNFHLISDILDSLDITEHKLLKRCDKVVPLEMSVAKVIEQMSLSFYKLPEKVLNSPPQRRLRFLPLCAQLRQLLDIQVENLDD